MKPLAYLSLAALVSTFLVGSIDAAFFPADKSQSGLLLSIFSKLMIVWIISGVMVWIYGFVNIAKKWNARGAAKSILFIMLNLTLFVFFAYFLCLVGDKPNSSKS